MKSAALREAPCFVHLSYEKLPTGGYCIMKKMISRRNFLTAAGVVAAAGVLTDNFVTVKPLCYRKLFMIHRESIVPVYIAEKSKK
mgnify:CR=1 FL=1